MIPLLLTLAQAVEPVWVFTEAGKEAAISGIALRGEDGGALSLVVVHDNKGTEGAVELITLRDGVPSFAPIAWPLPYPVDLEAVANIPGAESDLVVAQSDGHLARVRLGEGALTIVGVWTLPGADQLEGLSVRAGANGSLLALWANRGGAADGAVVSSSTLLANGKVKATKVLARVRSPLVESPHSRHITDLYVDPDGQVWASAALDPGDDGPFRSALWALGSWDGKRWTHAPADAPKFCIDTHKVEGLSRARDGWLLGADDETAGGFLSWAGAGELNRCP